MQHGSGTVGWLLVALCLASGLYCLTRLPHASGIRRLGAGIEAVMGLAMAAMAVPGAMPSPWTTASFVVLFGALTLVSLAGAARGLPHGLHHALEAAAMVYMVLVMPGGVPLLTGALLLYFAVQVLRTGLTLLPAGAAAHPAAPGVRQVPDLSCACRLSLATGTFAMLLTL
jgi:hypothetical protein